MEPPRRKVLIALEMNEVSGRRQLSGILHFLGSSGRWNIQLLQRAAELTPDIARFIAEERFDGLLTGINDGDSKVDIQLILSACSTPAVFMDAEPRVSTRSPKARRAFIHIDDTSIGIMAAQHLLSLGYFRSIGFVPERNNAKWSTNRLKAFQAELNRQGRTCLAFAGRFEDEHVYRRHLGDWIQHLAKPAAIFCAWDTVAVPVVDVCHERRLVIPSQVAILGVDDDDFLCNLVSPGLSSIRPDFEGEGFAAARALDRLMSGHPVARSSLRNLKPEGITERGSTRHMSPSGLLVQRALAFIDLNACRGIGVADVVAHLGVSRSLADLRFRQLVGASILSTILRRRLDEIQRLLKTTDYPISRITSLCGFKSENYPKNLFCRTFGLSMRAWRQRESRVP